MRFTTGELFITLDMSNILKMQPTKRTITICAYKKRKKKEKKKKKRRKEKKRKVYCCADAPSLPKSKHLFAQEIMTPLTTMPLRATLHRQCQL
jgi:hypothetical protein